MVFKITGTVVTVQKKNINGLTIKFVGGVYSGKNLKAICTILTPDLVVRDHISKSFITGAVVDESGKGVNIACGSTTLLNVPKEVIMDALPWLYGKKKGAGATKTIDKQIEIALNNLTKKEMFMSFNPKSNFLTEDSLKGTHIEIIFHE